MKKILKKSLACMLAAILCLTACVGAMATVGAEGAITYAITDVTVNQGEKTVIDVAISNFADVAGLIAEITVPDAVKSIDSVKLNDTVELVAIGETAGHYIVDGKTVKFVGLFNSLNEFGDAFANVDALEINIAVTIAADAAAGETTFAAPVFQAGTANEEILAVNGAAGKLIVTVPCQHAETKTEETVNVAATCTTDGSKTVVKKCVACDAVVSTEEVVIKATGHAYDDGVVTTEPDCDDAGVKTFTCANCGDTYTEAVDALGHTPAEAVKENEVAAQPGVAGSYDMVVYCSVCKAFISKTTHEIPALPVEPQGPQLNENILIRDPDINIDSTLFIRLRIDKRTLPADVASYEMVVIPTKYDVEDSSNYYNEIVGKEIPLTLDSSSTTNYAVYYYKDAAMYELGLSIDAYVKCYDANGNYIYYSNTKTYTPSVGLTALFTTTSSESTKKVVTDLLNMGAAAQEYIASQTAAKDSDAYNTVMAGNLVNAGLTTQQYAGTLGTVDTTNTTVKNPDATYNETVKPAFSLGVAPTAALQVYKASNMKDNFTLEVSYTSNRDAQKISYEVAGDQWSTSGTKLVHYASGIAYYDGNAVITMKLYHNGVEVSTTTYTVEAGLSALFSNANPKMVAFAQATAIFGATIRARMLG